MRAEPGTQGWSNRPCKKVHHSRLRKYCLPAAPPPALKSLSALSDGTVCAGSRPPNAERPPTSFDRLSMVSKRRVSRGRREADDDHVQSLWDYEALHTPEALRARAALRHHALVEDVLEVWWQCAVRSMELSGNHARGYALCEDDYVEISRKLFRTMIQPWDDGEATRNARKEWLEDVAGLEQTPPVLPGERFKDAIFEYCRRAHRTLFVPPASPALPASMTRPADG